MSTTPGWLVSWPAIIVGLLLCLIPGLILLWLRPMTPAKLKAAVSAIAVGLILLVVAGGFRAPSGAPTPASPAGESQGQGSSGGSMDTPEATNEPSPSVATSEAVRGPDEPERGEGSATRSDGLGAAEKGVVNNVVDGDTIDVEGVGRIRLIGIDTPERGACGFDSATQALTVLVLGREVQLVRGTVDDADRYGRLLRYVDVAGDDAGMSLIEDGWAIARYDSRDGYDPHPREEAYIVADEDSPNRGCYDDLEP